MGSVQLCLQKYKVILILVVIFSDGIVFVYWNFNFSSFSDGIVFVSWKITSICRPLKYTSQFNVFILKTKTMSIHFHLNDEYKI